MVLSLAFILALVGAGAGLLVGIFIFGEVSDAIICPASEVIGGGGSLNITSYDNLGTLGSVADAVYYEYESPSSFVSTTGIINQGVVQNGTSSLDTNGEIYLGLTASTWDFIHKGGVGSDEVSINFWINGDVDGAPGYPLLTNRHFNNLTGIWIYTQGTTAYVAVFENLNNNRVYEAFLGGLPPDDSQWHMVSVTYDKSITTGNANVDYYLDGVLIGTGTTDSNWTGAGGSAEDVLTIGSDVDHNPGGGVIENTFDVDDVAIWNGYALTGTDVTNLYNSGNGLAASSVASSNLRGYWSFDDSTANAVGGGGGSSPSETGSEQCESAKETAWTVIGIMPVALFFGLFALFSSVMGRPT